MRISDWSSDVCSSDLAMSVLMIDADHFKRVNDDHGHEAGDAVLVELVRRLRNVLRNQDVIGRVGGEEFLALLPGADQRAALEIADRLLDVMRETPIRPDAVERKGIV